MQLGLSLGLTRGGGQTLIQRAIASLRARGSDAHLWLPGVGTINGLQTGNYLESTGNSVATVDNPVGLVLDALGTVGAELVTNGSNPTTTTGWATGGGDATLAASGGSFVGNSGSGSNVVAIGSVSLTAGQTYIASVLVSAVNSSSALRIRVGTAGAATVVSNSGAYSSSVGFWRGIFTATTGQDHIEFAGGGAISTATFNNISVREVSGIHLTQGTTANKPVLRRGAYNLLINSVLAGGTSGVEGSGAVAPTSWSFGASTGSVTFASESIRFVAAAQRPFIVQTTTSLSVGVYVLTVRVLSVGAVTTVADIIGVGVGTATVSVTYIKNNAACLSSATYSAGDTVGAVLTVTVAGTVPARVGCGAAGASTGDVTLSSPQFEVGSTASAYSPTTTAAASNPDAGKYSWSFDGSNDSLLTGNLGITNACTIVIAGRLDSLGVINVLFGEDANGVYFFVQSSGAVLLWKNGVGPMATSSVGEIVAGVPFVLTCRLSGGTAVIRKNGIQAVSSVTGQTFTATTGAKIGTNFAGANPIAGTIGTVAALPVALTDAECLLVERMAASQFPNGPVF